MLYFFKHACMCKDICMKPQWKIMQVTWVPESVLPSDDHVTFGKVSAHHRTDRPKFAHPCLG